MPACMHACSVMSDSLQPPGLEPTRILCQWHSASKNTGACCHCLLLQSIFLTYGLNPLSPESPALLGKFFTTVTLGKCLRNKLLRLDYFLTYPQNLACHRCAWLNKFLLNKWINMVIISIILVFKISKMRHKHYKQSIYSHRVMKWQSYLLIYTISAWLQICKLSYQLKNNGLGVVASEEIHCNTYKLIW